MNKKVLTGFMLLLTAGIWGYVGLQFFSGQNNDADDFADDPDPGKPVPVLHIEKTGKLLLNYPDPFLREDAKPLTPMTKTSKPAVKFPPPKKEAKTILPAFTWPSIVYKGLIQNKNHPEKLIGVILIDGQEKIIREGEKINGLSISSIEKNSIEIACEKEKKVFSK